MRPSVNLLAALAICVAGPVLAEETPAAPAPEVKAETPAAPAAPAEEKPERPSLRKLIKDADADKDGKVTFEEITKFAPEFPRNVFDRHDANKDGALTESEMPERPATDAKPPRTPGGGRDRLREADKDGDKKISLEEFKAAYPDASEDRFKSLDKNSDGFVTQDERPAPPSRDTTKKPDAEDKGDTDHAKPGDANSGDDVVAKLITDADKDKDGKVTPEELKEAKPGMPEDAFKRLDTNSDGAISKDDHPAVQPRGGAGANAEMAQKLRDADKDGDKKVSFDEAKAAIPEITRARFDARDKNKDGFISRDDRVAATPAP